MDKLVTINEVKVEVGEKEIYPPLFTKTSPLWNSSGIYWGIAYAMKSSKGVYKPVNFLSSCRTYLNEYLYVRDNPQYACIYPIKNETKVDKDRTNILFYRNVQEDITKLKKRMRKYIWGREEKIGLPKTRVHLVEDQNKGITYYVFVGSKEWQSNLWKLSMYTRYLKKVVYNTPEYWDLLMKNEDILLSKVKGFYEEIIAGEGKSPFLYQDMIHTRSGFVSILTRFNNPMYELLFEKPGFVRPD